MNPPISMAGIRSFAFAAILVGSQAFGMTPAHSPYATASTELGASRDTHGTATATISGTLTAPGGSSFCATGLRFNPVTATYDIYLTVNADPVPFTNEHQFSLPIDQPGSYKVLLWECGEYWWDLPTRRNRNTGFEFLDSQPTLGSATVYTISGGENIVVNSTLAAAGGIEGVLFQANGQFADGVELKAVDASGFRLPWTSVSDGGGNFLVSGLRGGSGYQLEISDPLGRFPTLILDDPRNFENGVIPVTSGTNKYVYAYLNSPMPTNVALVDPESGKWYRRTAQGRYLQEFYYGNPRDVPFLGDWDCDGIATPGLFRPSDAYAYLRNSNDQGVADIKFYFGNPGDVPMAGDWDGDGCDTVSIYRPSNQTFYIMNRLGSADNGLGAADYSFVFGNPGDQPVRGDWDGDGIDEIGLYRKSSGYFYYRNTLDAGVATGQFYFGEPGDRFVAGDWGVPDGKDTPAVYRPSTLTFYFRHSLTAGVADSTLTFGFSYRWIPVAGNGRGPSPFESAPPVG